MYFLCQLSDLKKKDYLIKEIEQIKEEVIIFENTENEIEIFSSICPHFGGEISYLKNKNKFKCKWHGWEFSPSDGKCLSFVIKGKLSQYKLNLEPQNLSKYNYKIEDEKIYLVV